VNKLHYKLIQRAWLAFDRSTALGCAQSGRPYDRELAIKKWNDYNTVLEDCGYAKVTHATPFN
jgi:hypothetical protein